MDSDLRRQIALTLGTALAGLVILGGPLLALGALANDRLGDFYFFRDTLHSLNVYGEYPWWNPSYWAGFPSYFTQILYWPGRGPLFALPALLAWAAGRLGFVIESYHALYVVYFALLVPLALNFGLLALARQILRRPPAVYLAVVLAGFSPGVVLSLSDNGTESAAYGFWFAAALIAFLRRPRRTTFALLALSCMALGLSLSYYDLFWNVFFVPLFLALVLVSGTGIVNRARRAARAISPVAWALAAAGVAICALPSVLTYTHGEDILVVQTGGAQRYRYESLRPGNPLEMLAISTPGVGFEWPEYASPDASFEPRALSRTSGYLSFGYMGVITLPLVVLGLVAGRSFWSLRLFLGISGVGAVMLLSAYSPLFSLVLAWPSPLQAVNHYSDYPVRVGLFALFILAAGLGLEWVLGATSRRRILGWLGATSAALSTVWLAGLHGGAAATGNFVFGLALAFMFLELVAVARLAFARTPAQLRTALVVLLVVLGADTATFAFAHLRLALSHASGLAREPGPETIGSITGREEDAFLYLRGLNDPSLLTDHVERLREPGTLAASPDGPALDGSIRVEGSTYNSLALHIDAPQAAVLELRDAYFPFWTARVDDVPVAVERSPRGMKMIRVPAGPHDVEFRFSPTAVQLSVRAAYAAFVAGLLLWFRARRAEALG